MPYLSADAQREFQRKFIKRRRDEWIASKGGVCAQCGSDERLEVDHIDPATKVCNPRGIWSRNENFRHAELAKCQVLCHECHKAKTRSQFAKPCGTNAAYRRGCRCRPCKDACAAAMRKRRARKRAEVLMLAR